MSPGGVLHRSYRDGDVRAPAFLDDVAAVANGLLELHTATGEPRWLEQAIRLAEDAAERFHDDEAGGFLYADPAGERLVARLKDLDDNPTPSGQSLLATVLLRLSRITGRGEAARAGGLPAGDAPRRACVPRLRAAAVRARPVPLAAGRGGGDRAAVRPGDPRAGRRGPRRVPPDRRLRLRRRHARRAASPCSRARAWSAASPRCTCASGSPARRRSPIPALLEVPA